MWTVTLLTLVAAVLSAEGSVGDALVACPEETCTCPRPNTFPGDLVHMKEAGCLCPCGKPEGELCMETGECAVSTECAAPTDFATHEDKTKGVCTDRCKSKECPSYYSCRIHAVSGQPTCSHERFSCDDSVVMNVKALKTGVFNVFTNRCLMENANEAILNADPTNNDLWRVAPQPSTLA